jgi:hypothetical protein
MTPQEFEAMGDLRNYAQAAVNTTYLAKKGRR